MEFALPYIAILLLTLVVAGLVLHRRRQSRLELVARVRELTVLADLGRAIADAPLDLGRLAEVVYAQARQIVATSYFQLGLFEGDRYRLLIWVQDGARQPVTEFHLQPASPGIVGWVRASGRSLVVRDFEVERNSLPAEPRYLADDPPRSAVFVPLIADGIVLGVLAIQSRRPGAFTEEHLRLLTIVANHAAAALDKGHHFEQAERRAAHLAVLAEAAQQISVLQPLPTLYAQVVNTVAAKLPGYEICFFAKHGQSLNLQATSAPAADLPPGAAAAAAPAIADEAAAVGKALVRETLAGSEAHEGAARPRQVELAVPVVIHEKVLGVLYASARSLAHFDPGVQSLFESLAAQLAIAILEADLYSTERRRADQLTTIALVSRTIVSNLALEDLFDDVLDRVEESFGYKRAHIFVAQDDKLIFRAGIGKGAARWSVRGYGYDLNGPGLIPLVARTREGLVVADVMAHPQYLPGVGLEDTRSQMTAPMLMAGSLLGVFDVQSDRVGQFSSDDLQILQTLTDTLAVAVRNARLFEIERRRRLLAETLREVSAALTTTLDLDAVLALILSSLERVVTFDAASILLANEDGVPVLRAIRGLPELRQAVGDEFNVRLFGADEDLPATIYFEEADPDHEYHDLLSLPEPHACLAALLRLQGQHVGYLVVDRGGDTRFVKGEVELISAFASQASIAIENARLYAAQQEQAWVSAALLQVAEATTQAANLSDVIETVVRLTPMLVGVNRCAVLLAEGFEYSVQAFYAVSEPSPPLNAMPPVAPEDWPKLQQAVLTREPTVSLAGEENASFPAALQPLFSDVIILLPLVVKGAVEGVLTVGQTFGEAPFNAHRIQLLSGIANQTALAIDNALSYESQQEEAWVSAALLQVAEAVAQPGALGEALESVARLTPMVVGIEQVVIFQWDNTGQIFRASQGHGLPKAREAELLTMSFQPDALGVDPQGAPRHPVMELRLPQALAACLEFDTAMLWPLRAHGDLLGALLVPHVPAPQLGRRLAILDGIAHQLSLAMENARLARELAQQHRLERDIELAREIQASFLPEACPLVPGWELCSHWEAARQVGGDFYDFVHLPPDEDGHERWGIVIADVADKGVAAALYMALSRTLMRTVAISRVWPAATLSRVNELIHSDTKTDLFVTIFYGVWRPADGRFQYANAGHNPPLLVGPERSAHSLPGRGVPLGVFDETSYEEHEVTIGRGEALFLYTDGLPDAVNVSEQEFGIRRMQAVVENAIAKGAAEIMSDISEAVHAHVGVAEAFDDLTMVVIKRLESAAG